jgi:hypothetical protein
VGYGGATQVRYAYRHDAAARTLAVEFGGTAQRYVVRLPLPEGRRVTRARLDGRVVEPRLETVGASVYCVTDAAAPGKWEVVYQ